MRMQGNPQGSAAAVVLFDIDGTLIRRAGPQHREALVEAVRRVTGLEAGIDHIPVQGMLDRKILETMLLDAGASMGLVRRSMRRLVEQAQGIYARRCPASLRAKTCPGVRSVLYRLKRREIPAGLVTGNLSRIGWKKMERAGLKEYFRFGAFAEQAGERAGLVRIAVREARSRGWMNGATPVWLVGDHPNDILAAKANGVGSVAVATGLSSREELGAHKPDLLLDDLRGLRLEMLLK
ncbi:MAG: HAD family hydrolase [Acidimicrobiia bacterium]|nr:HAD family hydrolase [Acidimicrobiia bacterium]